MFPKLVRLLIRFNQLNKFATKDKTTWRWSIMKAIPRTEIVQQFRCMPPMWPTPFWTLVQHVVPWTLRWTHSKRISPEKLLVWSPNSKPQNNRISYFHEWLSCSSGSVCSQRYLFKYIPLIFDPQVAALVGIFFFSFRKKKQGKCKWNWIVK